MSEFIINIQNSAGTNRGSVTPDVGFNYTDNLNDVNEATMTFSSLSSNDRSLLALGNLVEIQRNGTVEFFGFIDSISNTVGGGMQVHASGHEIWLAKENGTYSNSPWNDEATEDIFDDLIGDSTYLVLGTTDNAFDFDFRANQSQSILENIKNLLAKTGQDMEIDYTTLNYGTATTYGITMNITDAKGSTTSVATFSQGINIRNLLSKQSYPRANKILVYGKGDGENQITGSDSDATSISTYGEITKTIVDSTVMTTREANKLAEKTLPLYKDPQKYFFFDMVDPNVDLESGDVATLQSPEHDLSDESVRIVGIDRGQTLGQEFLKLEVSDTVSNKRLQKRNRFMAELEEQSRENNSYKQGSGNTMQWAQKLNGKSGAPLVIAFNIPSSYVTDEAGDIRVSSFTLDYDIDPFRSNIGSTTESNTSPALTAGTQTNSHNHSVNDSGHDHTNSTVTSEVVLGSQGDVTNDNASTTAINFSNTSFTGIGSSFSAPRADIESYVFHISIHNDDTSTAYVYFRVYLGNSGGAKYFPDSSGIRCRVEGGAGTGTVITVPVNAYVQSLTSAQHLQCYVTDTGGSALTNDIDMMISMYSIDSHVHSVDVADTASDTATIGETNTSPTVTGAAVGHNHGVSIGDDVTDSGSVNSTELSTIKVYWWNGASWTLKHTISTTGTTIDTDVDLSNSGTLPDAAGFWKVELDPDSSSADLLQGIVKVKHSLDN